MQIRTTHALVGRYLKRLESELDDLPAARRRDIRSAIHQRIDEALADPTPSDTEVRRVLEEMGPPDRVALRERERFGLLPPVGGAREMLAIVLLLVGGIVVPVLGWLVGVALLWSSPVWTRRDRLIGTLVVPGGLALPFGIGFVAMVEPALPTLVVSMVLVLSSFAAVATAVYLRARMRRAGARART